MQTAIRFSKRHTPIARYLDVKNRIKPKIAEISVKNNAKTATNHACTVSWGEVK